MRAIFDRFYGRLRKGRCVAGRSSILVRAATDRPLAAVIQKRYARFRRKLTTVIERWQSEGAVRSDIPADLLADQVSAMADGWTMMFPVEPNRFSRGRINDLLNAAIAMLKRKVSIEIAILMDRLFTVQILTIAGYPEFLPSR